MSSISTAARRSWTTRRLQNLVQRTRKAGAWIVPTMLVLRAAGTCDAGVAYQPIPSCSTCPRPRSHSGRKPSRRVKNPQFNAAQAKLHIDNRNRILKALQAGGVRILLGSDAPQQFNVPGFSIHREMKSMADAGIGTYEIVKSGTANVGEYSRRRTRSGQSRRAGRPGARRRQSAAEPRQHGETVGSHSWPLAASSRSTRGLRRSLPRDEATDVSH